jgi:hypothetical protein
MITIVNIIALVIGVLFGFWCFGRQAISWLFILIHTSMISSKASFYELYDRADDEVSFDWYKDHNKDIKKYADYLKLHAAARESAYASFKRTSRSLRRSLLLRVIPIALAPAIIFWTNWHFYLAGVGIIFIAMVGYEAARHGLRPGFYQRLVIYTILSTYTNNLAKVTQR